MKISSANTNKVQFLTKSKSNPNEFQYKEKRIKNNEAVKKSRKKSKDNNKVTLEKVTEMKEENKELEERIKSVGAELQFLLEIYTAHLKDSHSNISPPKCLYDIKSVL